MFVTKYSTRIPLLNRFGSASSRLFCASVDTPNTNQLRPQRTIDPSFYEIPIYTPSEKIQGLVERYMANIARFEANQYLGEDSKRAFARALHFVDQFYLNKEASSNSNGGKTKLERYVILDSGCGRGMSTIKLAKRFPDVPVIGVDRSRRRLLTNTHYTPTPGSNDPRDLPENRLKFLSKYKTGRNKEVGDGDEEEDDFEDDEEDSNSLTSLQHEPTPPNALLLHAELADFWRLVYDHSDWIVQKHFLLHPNPYPKLKNLKKRWHGK